MKKTKTKPFKVFISSGELPHDTTWTSCFNMTSLFKKLLDKGVPEYVSVEHDLFEEHKSPLSSRGRAYYNDLYSNFIFPTGLDFILYIFNFAKQNGGKVKKLEIRGKNIAGNKNISVFAKNSGIFEKIVYI